MSPVSKIDPKTLTDRQLLEELLAHMKNLTTIETVKYVEELLNPPTVCDNCEAVREYNALDDTERLHERMDKGGPIPAGQCPDCGALAYIQD